MNRAKLFKAFKMHGYNAKKRSIAFLLTFEEWLEVWIKSGKVNERGNGYNQYVMARYGDVGPYSIENVKIICSAENLIEGRVGRKMSAEACAKISSSRIGKRPPNFGRPHSVETCAKMRLKAIGRIVSEETKKKMSEARKRYLNEQK